MYEKLEFCPICKNTNFTNHIICTDHSVSGESFALVKCTKCDLVFTNPRPSESALPNYYKSDQYISHTNKANTLINFVYKIVRGYTLRKKVELLNQYSKTGPILDYGCGTGDFLQACQKNDWETYGYEPDEKAASIASKKKLTLTNNIETLPKLNVITAWHVIEHISQLRPTIKKLSKRLKEDGILIIAVPNINSHDCLHYKEYWAAYDVPRHLYHFSQESFGKLIAKTKLKLIDILPMKFDSFYVSMLSEKYKNGKNNFLSALKVGLRSNKDAKRTGEYSSLIYILKK